MCSVGDSGPVSTVTIGEMIFQNGKANTHTHTHTPLAKVLNKTDDSLPFIYTSVTFLENLVLVKTTQKLLCIFI